MSNGIKNDTAARLIFGESYNAIPKSVFAVAAFYFAQRCGEREGDELQTIASELETLAANGIVDTAQVKRAIAALARES